MKNFRLAFFTIWFMFAWVSMAHAGPVVALFGAIGSFLVSGSALAQVVVGALLTAAKVGISLLLNSGKETEKAGISQDISYGGNNPLSFIMGAYATSGQLEYGCTFGEDGDTPNAYLTRVISISDIGCEITGFYIDDTHVPMPTGTDGNIGRAIPAYLDDGDNYAWVRAHDGSQTVVDPGLYQKFGGRANQPWLNDMVGRGIAYYLITFRYNTKKFNGPPALLAETTGIPLYDIRKDSSRGGDGDHRWDDYSTFEPSSNPAVQMYNICRGIRYEDTVVWGGDYEDYELPASSWMAAMNACDVQITNKDGSKSAQYQSGIEIKVNEEPAAILEELLKACNGRWSNTAGFTTVLIGTPGAPVYSFTDDQVIVTDAMGLDPFPTGDAIYNGASASYPEPAIKWGPKNAPPYIQPDLIALDDGQERLLDIQYRACPYALQVQRLMQQAVDDYRRFKVHTLLLAPEAIVLAVNDIVSWTSAYNQYVNKKFIVVEIQPTANLLFALTLKEIDPADNVWNPLTDEKDYTLGSLEPVIPPTQLMTGWTAAPAERKGLPAIQVGFSGKLDDVQYVRVQVRLKSDQSLLFDGQVIYDNPATNPDPKFVILDATFAPDIEVEVRGKFIPFSDRDTEWSGWLTVTTPAIWPSDSGPVDAEDLAEDLTGFNKWIGENIRQLRNDLDRINQVASNQNSFGYMDRQAIRRELVSTSNGLTASFNEAILVATGPNSALAQSIEALQVQVDEDIAQAITSLQTEINVVDNKTTANANAITSLEAQVDGIAAGVNIRGEVQVSPGEGWARYGVQVYVETTEQWSQVAYYMDVKPGLSRFVVDANQFIVTDSTLSLDVQPFVISGGEVYMENAHLGTLFFDQLSSNNNKLIMRGYADFADFSLFV